MNNILAQFARVRAFVFDIDGVFTDGLLYLSTHRDDLPLRTCNSKDGYAVQVAVRKRYPIAIISGAHARNVEMRMRKLGITDIYMQSKDKFADLQHWMSGKPFHLREVLYMGDDMMDLPCMRQVGMPTCPQDAAEDVCRSSLYVSPFAGGRGCVRDVIEKVLKLQGNWE